ncbi:hypothetical protein LBMAG41_27310 [Cyanobium sp.]|nr:hypothetical protein LBMAG41_27310 [Cyanobium sp.]
MISTSSKSHYCPISSLALANWLRRNHPDKLWSIDGEEKLSAHLDFPCSTEDLATKLHAINERLQVQVPKSVDQLDDSTLDQAVQHFPVSPGESDEFMSFSLYWADQSPEDAWALSEDLTEDS